jgi:hypothetical protein
MHTAPKPANLRRMRVRLAAAALPPADQMRGYLEYAARAPTPSLDERVTAANSLSAAAMVGVSALIDCSYFPAS